MTPAPARGKTVNALGDLILSARTRPGSPAGLAGRRSSLSDAALVESAWAAADLVRAETDRPTPMAAVALPLSEQAVVWLLAAVLGDFSLCFLDPAAPTPRQEAVLDALDPDVVVDRTGLRAPDGPRRPAAHDRAAGYVAMSSGSTGGAPKGVLSSWSSIAAFAPFGAEALGLEGDAVWAEVSHPSYDLAMTNLLVALAAGSAIRVSSALGDRLRPLAFTERVRATHLRLAPRFIELAAAEQAEPGTSRLRVWGSGGDRLPASHARQVFGFGVPVLVNTYGTSETIGFASAARLSATEPLPTHQGTVTIGRGTVGPWRTRLEERDGQTMLAIESPHLPAGYVFGQPHGDYPRWIGHERVATGDVGVRLDTHLFCLGRAGRRVKRSASFVDLDEVDATIRDATGATSFTVATAAGLLVSLLEGVGGRDLRPELVATLRPDTVPDRLVRIPQLPRLDNGKIDHAEALRLAEGCTAPRPDGPDPRGERR